MDDAAAWLHTVVNKNHIMEVLVKRFANENIG